MDEDTVLILGFIVDVLVSVFMAYIAMFATELVYAYLLHREIPFKIDYVYWGVLVSLLFPVPTKKYNSL